MPKCKPNGEGANVRVDFKHTGYEDMRWIQLAQDSVKWQVIINAVMNIGVPLETNSF
jgi:hypothetical protein